MVSVDTDKLIRDKAKAIADAAIAHIRAFSRPNQRPDLCQAELLDEVIARLKAEHHAVINGWRGPNERALTESEAVAGAAARLGLTVVEMPLREAEPSNVIGLPRIGK